MSNLLENKQQMIHIASEVVVLLGLTFYFNQQNKKLTGHIEDLAQRIEEQEDLIQNHENVIKQLVEQVNLLAKRQQNMLSDVPQPQVVPISQPAPRQTVTLLPNLKTRRPKHTEPPLNAPEQTRPHTEARVQFQEPEPTHAVITAQMTRRDHDEPPPQRNTIDVNAIMHQQAAHREQEDAQYSEDSDDENENDLDQELVDELEDLDDNLKKQ